MAQLAGTNERSDAIAQSQPDEQNKVQPVDLPHAPSPAQDKLRKSTPAKSASPLDALSRSLQQAYQTDLAEPIPDAFMDLLRKLD